MAAIPVALCVSPRSGRSSEPSCEAGTHPRDGQGFVCHQAHTLTGLQSWHRAKAARNGHGRACHARVLLQNYAALGPDPACSMGTAVRHRLRTWVDLVAGSAARKALLAGGLRRAAEDPPWCRRRSDSSFRVDADDAVQQGLEHICEQQSGSGRGSWGHLGGGSVLGIRQGGGRIAVDHGSQWCQALRMMGHHAAGMPLAEYERRGRTAYLSAGRWKGSRTRFSRLP